MIQRECLAKLSKQSESKNSKKRSRDCSGGLHSSYKKFVLTVFFSEKYISPNCSNDVSHTNNTLNRLLK